MRMGTLVAVIKDGEGCIASDSLNVRDTSLRPEINGNHSCIIRVGEAYLGLASSVAYQQAFESVLQNIFGRSVPALTTRDEIFRFFSRMHEVMRGSTFMNVIYQQGQEFEWSPLSALIVSRGGLFKVDSARGVYALKKFWALGTGENYALGALQALYDADLDSEEIARNALSAVTEFDQLSGRQFLPYSIASTRPTPPRKVKSITSMKRNKASARNTSQPTGPEAA
jgi:ATP-dependent HslUV protease subunit HslV